MRSSVKWTSGMWLAGIGMMMATATSAADMKKVAISTIVEVPRLMETKDGILKALAERGFVVGKTIELDYQSANGSMPTQQQIAERFVSEGVDVTSSRSPRRHRRPWSR